MNRYACKGCIKITIYEDLASSDIEIKHLVHPTKPNVSISPEIKQFIQDNIDLLHVKYINDLLNVIWTLIFTKSKFTFGGLNLERIDTNVMKILFFQHKSGLRKRHII